jgi:heterodisulfide reductase subunit A
MNRRTGLFFCRCGPNLGQVVDLDRLSDPALWPGAAVVEQHPVLCSEEGKAWLAGRIREERLDSVVLAACSPREHEATFQGVLGEAGLNPFMLQMANIREQCEWVCSEGGQATAKALRLVGAAFARAPLHEPMAVSELECNPDVLVLGSGVAGLSAALSLMQKGRRVTLMERDWVLGGRVNLLDEVYPGMECASCFLEPALDKVMHDERVTILTGTQVTEVVGSYGNFTVRALRRARHVDPSACLGCGSCAGACPVEVPDGYAAFLGLRKAIFMPYEGCLPHASVLDEAACLRFNGGECEACAQACPFGAIALDEGSGQVEIACGALVIATGAASGEPRTADGGGRVLSCFQLERVLHPNGPTGGKLLMPGGSEPRSILLALTEGGRSDGVVAWNELLKLGARARATVPGIRLSLAGGPARALGPGSDLLEELRSAGARFYPGVLAGVSGGNGGPLQAKLESEEGVEEVEADLVILYPLSLPSPGSRDLARLLRLRTRPDGFLEDRAGPFETASSGTLGIYVAGSAGGMRSIAASIQDGAAAAARALSGLVPGEKITLEPLVSEVDPLKCSACGICMAACPFGAVGRDPETRRSRVAAALCRGCGTCAAACPSGAIRARHFTKRQILAEVRGLLDATEQKGA